MQCWEGSEPDDFMEIKCHMSIDPVNAARLDEWKRRYYVVTGKKPSNEPHVVLSCTCCGRPVWVPDQWLKEASPFDLAKVTCGDRCETELEELRAEKHWS